MMGSNVSGTMTVACKNEVAMSKVVFPVEAKSQRGGEESDSADKPSCFVGNCGLAGGASYTWHTGMQDVGSRIGTACACSQST